MSTPSTTSRLRGRALVGASGESLLERVLGVFQGKRAPLLLAAVGLVLALPALRHGFQADDNVFRTLVTDGHRPWHLFYFSPDDIAFAREVGIFPWWTSPNLTFAFMRPLASLMHFYEFTWLPDGPGWMRLISLAVYAATVAVAALAYREVIPDARAAALAGLLFAIDDGHAVSASWISARNTSLATLFSLLAFLLQRRATATGRLSLRLASAGCVALALASAEAGLWSLAYLFAAAIALDRDSIASRARALAPHLVVTALWLAVYLSGDFGMHGSGWYRSIASPLAVLWQGALDLPLWIASAFGPGGVDMAVAQPTGLARLVALPVAAVYLAVLLPLLRSSQYSRFFALGAFACIAPMFTTIPQDRLLLGASFGAMGWIGIFLAEATQPLYARAGADGTEPFRRRWGRRLHLATHACLAPLLFPILAGNPEMMQRTHLALAHAAVPGRDVVLIDSPAEPLNYYAYHTIAADTAGRGVPRSLHQLYAGTSELWLERVDERTLDLRAVSGWGRTPAERFFASAADMPPVGSTRQVGAMTITVLEANEQGMPARVRFQFPDRLEAEHRVWLVWEGRGPVPWTPPALGERKHVPAQPVISAMVL